MKKLLLCAFAFGAFMTAKAQPANDACINSIDVSSAFNGGTINQFTQLGPYSNVDATAGDVDVADVTGCWFDDLGGVGDGNDPDIDHTVWFSFEGDGLLYAVIADNCLGTAVFGVADSTGDTQMVIYSGSCVDGTVVACNDDIDTANGVYWAGAAVQTEDNTTYYIAIDGFNYTGFGSATNPLNTGEFCLQIAQTAVSVEEVAAPQFVVYPNPSHGSFTINGKEKLTSVVVRNLIGEIVFAQYNMNTNTFRVDQPMANGVYFVDASTANGKSTTKLVVE